ncbi:hypothetical protein [Tenacibaculum ascidiaceicola]|uniref:hypothetical protein n=1 Tax=Tenacibaculum ascidiaceicola TaxID=1699411 RepID=UPI003894E323
MIKEEQNLKALMFKQATAFLEDAEEFFPYGTIVKTNGETVPVGVYDGNEYIESNEIIDILEKNLSSRILDKEATLAGIGIDVIINHENEKGEEERRNALMIKTSTDGINWKEDYYLYRVERKVVWE